MIVYLLKCIVNQKEYVGLTTTTLDERWEKHVAAARTTHPRIRGCMRVVKAIAKYGPEAFERSVLQTCSSLEELVTAEKMHIASRGTRDPAQGYNDTEGGDCPPSRKGVHHSDETRAKITKTTRGRSKSSEHREKIRAALKGRRLGTMTRAHRKPILALDEAGNPVASFPTLLDARAFVGYGGPPAYFKKWIERGRAFNGWTFVLIGKTVRQLKKEQNGLLGLLD